MTQLFYPLRASSGSSAGPAIVQSVQFQGDTNYALGNNTHVFNPNEPCGAGNCLVLIIPYNNTGPAISAISDTINGSWILTPAQNCVGAQFTMGAYLFPNCGAGLPIITVTFASTLTWVPAIMLHEVSGVATSSVFDNGNAQADQTYNGTNPITCGSFTPNHNNALVLAFFHTSTSGGTISAVTTSYTPSSGFTLLSTDTAWTTTGSDISKASTFQLQTTAQSVTPGIQPNGNTVDKWNCLAISLKGSIGSGTPRPSGIYIARRQFFVTVTVPNPWNIQFPFIGLPVLVTAANWIASITDTAGNTWTKIDTSNGGTAQFWYALGASPNSNLTVHIVPGGNTGAGSQFHTYFFDLVGAASSSVIGVDAYNATPNAGDASGNVLDMPDFTPTQVGSRVIVYAPNGIGPTLQVTSPSTAVFFNMGYTGENDSGYLNSGDGWAAFTPTNLSAQKFNWVIKTGVMGGLVAHAVEFKHS